MRIFKKIFVSALLTLMLFLSVNQSITFASSVGDTLDKAEAGWTRYNYNDANITYLGGKWFKDTSGPGTWNSPWERYGTSLKFNFTGTKLRLISTTWWSGSNSIDVFIDGVKVDNFSLEDKNKANNIKVSKIMYEKLGLAQGEHSVEFVNNTNSYIFIYSIDTDGQLKPFNLIKSGSQPGTEQPGTQQPGTQQPGTQQPGTQQPGTQQPGTQQPGTEQPGTQQPGTQQPGTQQPGTQQPGTQQPGTQQPGTQQPGTQQPGTQQPGTQQPGTQQPGTQQPGTQQPGTQQPGTEQPAEPTGDRAILTVTMDNGFDKEFDLSKKELNAFIAWYDAKDAGRGPSFFAIDKHNNNKGPFSNRKDYVIFNKILTFEVSEYSTK
ncbi:hypothetical protein ACFQY3_18730 [Paenibacillus farraposensis]|uniref:hypothetical protein n=1 Tax=Paenibacillus farraposensis TaxID=2807095 RepID=UPI00361CC7B6